MTDHEAALIAAARPFWDAEAEITRRFFARPPSRDDYIHYLRSAVYKELNPVIGYGPTDGFANGLHMEFCDIVERFRGLDDGDDRRDVLGALKMMTEEFTTWCSPRCSNSCSAASSRREMRASSRKT